MFRATHSWNTDDLKDSLGAVDQILEGQPDHAQATLIKLEILARQNKSAELLAALDNR
jgi:hypothetical protein